MQYTPNATRATKRAPFPARRPATPFLRRPAPTPVSDAMTPEALVSHESTQKVAHTFSRSESRSPTGCPSPRRPCLDSRCGLARASVGDLVDRPGTGRSGHDAFPGVGGDEDWDRLRSFLPRALADAMTGGGERIPVLVTVWEELRERIGSSCATPSPARAPERRPETCEILFRLNSQ